MKLYSYCIPVDDGAAPNPYWGKCTLVICKSVIRRVAEKGDWIVGLGSKNVNGIDYSRKVVYAMKVTEKITLSAYDKLCQSSMSSKIPDLNIVDYKRKLGDCIYSYKENNNILLRQSVHNEGNRTTDLGGKNALISDHFYYFGNNAIDLPAELSPIIKQGQGHKSNFNEPYKELFVTWIENLGYKVNSINGEPQVHITFSGIEKNGKLCADIRCKSAKEDEKLEMIKTEC